MKRIFKVILLTLIACSVRFIFSNVVNAETIQYQGVNGSAFSQSDFNDIATSFNNLKGNYTHYVCVLRPGYNSFLICFNYNNNNPLRARLSGEDPNNLFNTIISNSSYTWSMYELTGGGNGNLIHANVTSNLGTDYRFRFGFTNNLPWLCSNVPIYNYSNNNIYWAPDNYVSKTPPVIQNFEFTNVVNSMVAGEYFDVIVIANDYANTDIIFHINNGTLPGDTDEDYAKKYKYIILNSDSPYLMPTSEGSTAQGWKIPKSALIPIYDNCVYNMWLNYGTNQSLSTENKSLTTSFSELGKSMAVTDTQDATQDIANYLNNDEVDDADFELPEINVNDFTLSFFSSLVGSITDAFLDTTYDESITFDVRGTTYTIHSTEFDILGKVGLGVLKNFTALLWVFGIGYWIFCDARKRIMRLKEFNWTAMFADDISVDML